MAPQGEIVRAVCVAAPAGERPRLRWACAAPWADAASTLRRLRRERGLKRHRQVALLQRHQYQLIAIDAPDLPRAEWRDALRWSLKDMVDFPVADAAIDLLEVPGSDAASRRPPNLIAVAAAHAQLAPLADAAHDAGTRWQAIDIPETALRNLAARVEEPGRALALLHVADEQATLVITLGGELLATRRIEVTLAQITDADVDIRQPAWERASLELQRSLDSVERQHSQVGLSRLLVAPGAALAEFAAYVRDLVYVPVAAFDLAEAVDLADTPALADPAEQSAYLCAIGAALRSD